MAQLSSLKPGDVVKDRHGMGGRVVVEEKVTTSTSAWDGQQGSHAVLVKWMDGHEERRAWVPRADLLTPDEEQAARDALRAH